MTVNLAEVPATPVAAPAAPVLARARRLAVEVGKFSLVGGSGVAVNLLVFNALLHGLSVAPMAAAVLASCVAMVTNYLGFRFFAYRDRSTRTRGQIALFFAFGGIGVAMESALFTLGYHGLALDGPLGSNIAKGLSLLLASAFRFLVCRTWVFSRTP